MRKLLLTAIAFVLFTAAALAQSVGVDVHPAYVSKILEVKIINSGAASQLAGDIFVNHKTKQNE